MPTYEEPDGIDETLSQEAEKGEVDEAVVPRDEELLDSDEPLADPRLERARTPQAGL